MWTVGLIVFELLCTGAFLVSVLYFYLKYFVYDFWTKKGVVHPEPTFPFGNAGSLLKGREGFGDFFVNYYNTYKTHRFFGLFFLHKPNLVIVEPEVIKFVLAKEFSSFHDRGLYCNEKVDPLTGHLFLLPGKRWRNLRVKLTPTFTSGKIKQMFSTIKETGSLLTEFLDKHAKNKEIIEIKDIFARFSTDVIMSTAFGLSSNSIENPKSDFRHWGRKAFEPQLLWNSITVFAPKLMDMFSIRALDRGVSNFFTKTFQENINYRNDNHVIRRDFMDLLMQLMNKGYVPPDDDDVEESNESNKMEKLTMMESAAQAFVFFLAGFETSATTATHCLYELAIHQDIQDKVRDEIDQAMKKHEDGFTYDSINDMPYLHKVINETMRKYPPVPFLQRICTKEVALPETNVSIPEGVTVIIPVLGIHHDHLIYPDPEKFDPERFNEENVRARHSYAYLPFGEGPRNCIGMRFGLVQTKVAIVSALSKFRYKLGPNTPVPLQYETGSFVLTPKGGIHLIIESR